MEYISLRYVVRKMTKCIWLAVVVALIFAAGYVISVKMNSKTNEPADVVLETSYLEDPVTRRYLIYRMYWEENPLSFLPNSNMSLTGNSENVVNYIRGRLVSGASSYQWHQALCRQYPEIHENMREFGISIIEKEMLIVGVDHNSILWIDINSPLSLKDKNSIFTDEKLCAYRDRLRSLVAETIESGALTQDLPVRLERVREAEDAASEHNYLQKTAEDEMKGSAGKNAFSKKKAVLFALLGGLFVEGVVFLLAIMNNTVKDAENLKQNSDLDVLGVISKKANPEEWKTIAAKLLVIAGSEDTVYVIADSGSNAETKAAQLQQACIKLGKESPRLIGTVNWNDKANAMLMIANAKALIFVKQYKTDYKTLREMAECFRQIHAQVIGAVVEE